jgi:long-chain acyl-CoA synthetase
MSNLAAKSDQSGVYVWEDHYPEGQTWNVGLDAEPVFKILNDSVQKYGDKPAIDFEGINLTYNELGALSDKVAKGLQDLGVGKGIKVGLFLPNTHYSIAFYYGILKAGGTVVNYNPLYVEREIASQVEDSETDYLVTLNVEALLEKAENVLKETRMKGIILCPAGDGKEVPEGDIYIDYTSLINNEGDLTVPEIDPHEDIAVLQYTGGTTGVPKGAMLTHANLYANTQQIAFWHGDVPEGGKDKMVGALPLFHVFAMTVCMNMSLMLGFEVIILSKFDPEEFIKMLAEKKPGFVPAVPAIYNAVASHPLSSELDLSSVKFCLSGGAPLPGDVKRAFEEKTGAQIGEGYGLTEASPVLTCNPVSGKTKVGSVGQPIPGTVIEILSMEDGETVLATGEKGEVCASGVQIMKGYYNRPEATQETIRAGRLHTGDVGYLDEEGYLHLVDRMKDVILVRGYNVYPTQIEEAIYMHEAVEECIVAGVPDEERGETVWAWVKTLDGKTLAEEELMSFLKDKISPLELPRKVMIGSEPLPKTAVGKLSRKLLLEKEGIKKS